MATIGLDADALERIARSARPGMRDGPGDEVMRRAMRDAAELVEAMDADDLQGLAHDCSRIAADLDAPAAVRIFAGALGCLAERTARTGIVMSWTDDVIPAAVAIRHIRISERETA
jgi:hypothetical protein